MPETLSGLPAAGWFTDPADPASQRWWSGEQWSNEVRPIAQQPVLQTAGGGASVLTPSYNPSSFDSYVPEAPTHTVATSWFDPHTRDRMTPVPNPHATPALVLGIVTLFLGGFFITLIMTFTTASKALKFARTSEAQKREATGRRRAGWAIGLGLLNLLWGLAVCGMLYTLYTHGGKEYVENLWNGFLHSF